MEAQSERCINCLLCVNVCPLLRDSVSIFSPYPNTLVNIDRDEREKSLLVDVNYYCLTCLQCMVVCPRNLDPTKAIMEVRERYAKKLLRD